MKERILFECVGQAGGNVGKLFAEKGYVCHFINTSNDDLLSLDGIKDSFKYHIPNALGCNKDRKKAMLYTKDYHEHIVNIINTRFPRQDFVYFVFSLGGGTGSGISPILLDLLSQRNPNKTYGAIVILPSNTEPMKTQVNAIEAFKQLSKIEGLRNVFILDNNNGDKFLVNQKFVDRFETLMNISVPDPRGVIDHAELETLLKSRGVVVMANIDYPEYCGGKFSKAILADGIFASFKKGCQYVAVSMVDDEVTTEQLEADFGIPEDMFIGYNDDSTFIICTGLPIYTDRINVLASRVRSKQFDRSLPEVVDEIEVPIMQQRATKPKSEKVNFDDVFGKFMD